MIKEDSKNLNQNHQIDYSQEPDSPINEPVPEDSISQILKEKRLKVGMEITEVSAYLRIKIRDIEAIESGNWSTITQHTYIPSIVRSYAKLLRIDPKLTEEKIKLLTIRSNTDNKKYQLINIGENLDLKPNRDQFFNFLLISILLFLILLSLCHFYENKKGLITSEVLVKELSKFNEEFKSESVSNISEGMPVVNELEAFDQAIKQEQDLDAGQNAGQNSEPNQQEQNQ